MTDDKELLDWASYRSSITRNVSRASVPTEEQVTPEVSNFPGPNLTPAERRLAGSKAPANADGAKL